MNGCRYTNRGEEVPLGVECALPYLAKSTPSPNRGGAQRANPLGLPAVFRRWQGPAWKGMRLSLL